MEDNKTKGKEVKEILLLQNTAGLYRPVIQDSIGNLEAVGGWVKQKQTAINKVNKIVDTGKAEYKGEILQQDNVKPEQSKLFEVETVDYLTTRNGYAFDEVASALQKEIRRGNEEHAYFWARELETRYYKYLWKRLTIIASEDIGTANDQAVVVINSLRDNYFFLRENTKKELDVDMNILSHAILYLCRSPKSREADQFLLVMEADYRKHLGMLEPKKMEIPDYALDKHTKRGRQMKRGWEHFVNTASHVENEREDQNKYKHELPRMLASRLRTQLEGKGKGFTAEEWDAISQEDRETLLDDLAKRKMGEGNTF